MQFIKDAAKKAYHWTKDTGRWMIEKLPKHEDPTTELTCSKCGANLKFKFTSQVVGTGYFYCPNGCWE